MNLGSLELLVLSALFKKEQYGLEILKTIQEEETKYSKSKIVLGSIYPALYRLEKKGMATARFGDEVIKERYGRRRRYYKLTDLGEQALKEAQNVFADLWGVSLQRG